MGRTDIALCRRDCGMTGSFFHVIWECPKIQGYWDTIRDCLNEVLEFEEPKSVKLYLLNVWDATNLNRAGKIWYTLGLMIAKRNIARAILELLRRGGATSSERRSDEQ